MKLVNFNTNNAAPDNRISKMVDWLQSEAPDIIVFSELNYGKVDKWAGKLAANGYSLHTAKNNLHDRGAAVATNYESRFIPQLFDHGFAENLTVSAAVETPLGRIEVHAVYCPPDANRHFTETMKPGILASLPRSLAGRALPQIVTGDMNAPQAILSDGQWISWARRRSGNGWRLPGARTEEKRAWIEMKDDAETGLQNLRGDMHCAFTKVGRPNSPKTTWTNKRTGNSYRLDHILVSKTIMPRSVHFENDAIEVAGTDHRAIVAVW